MRHEGWTEQALHQAFWDSMQHAVQATEFAISEARDAIYVLLHALDDPQQNNAARLFADMWLDRNGRDPKLEVVQDA